MSIDIWGFETNFRIGDLFWPKMGTKCKERSCVAKKKFKFIFSEKDLTSPYYVVPVKSKVKIFQNFVAFSEYMNFTVFDVFFFCLPKV